MGHRAAEPLASWPTPDLPSRGCHLLTLLVLNCGFGLLAICRDFSALQRVSRLILCFILWVRPTPVSEDPSLMVHGRELCRLPLKNNFIKAELRKFWKHSHTGRRKHKFIISRVKENYYHPSAWRRRQEKNFKAVSLWVLALLSLNVYWIHRLVF